MEDVTRVYTIQIAIIHLRMSLAKLNANGYLSGHIINLFLRKSLEIQTGRAGKLYPSLEINIFDVQDRDGLGQE